jgi:bacteriocin-like protein
MTDKNQKQPDRIMVVAKDGSEISDEELEQIAGGVGKKVSKTIDVVIKKTDVDDPF